MKKSFSIPALFFLACMPVFADLPISAGFGFGLGYNNSGISGTSGDLKAKETFASFPYGFFTFVDIKYAEAGIGFSGIRTSIKHNGELSAATGADPADASLKGGMVNLSLSLKYPITLSRIVLFPVITMEGDIYVAMNYAKDNEWGKVGDSYGKASTWSSFWLRGGIGLDYFLTDSLFVRGVLTAGYKFGSSREKGIVELIKKNQDPGYGDVNYYGAGFRFSVAIGYSFAGSGVSRPRSSGSSIYYPRG